MYKPPTSTMRYTNPRNDLRAFDRRSGAYPTKARTGDRTRSGKNAFYFDDTRTVTFATGTSISLPTTFRAGSAHLATDLTSSFTVIGNSIPSDIDQWISERAQIERAGPFNESSLAEQNETNVVNSSFMTGVAYMVAPDRFKSKLSNKTTIRIEIPLTKVSALSQVSSSMHYLNPASGGFDLIANERDVELNTYFTHQNRPVGVRMLDPVLFGPFGYVNSPNHYPPINGNYLDVVKPSTALANITQFTANGSDLFDPRLAFAGGAFPGDMASASLINSRHAANVSQSIRLSDYLSSPFVLEKAVIELPFAAGPGWMNDAFAFFPFFGQGLFNNTVGFKKIMAGGPMITAGLLRQDKAGGGKRDLIASATFTNAFDCLTASYLLHSFSFDDSFNNTFRVGSEMIYTRTGLSGTVLPSFVVRGPVVSGSTNFFTGTVKLVMEPGITQHVMRVRASGTSGLAFFNAHNDYNPGYPLQSDRRDMAHVMTFGNFTQRPGQLSSGRNIYGNNLVLLPKNRIDGDVLPISGYESDNEGLTASTVGTVRYFKSKVFWDVVSKTQPSPYLLYPNDELILCLSKNRAAPFTGTYGGTADTSTFTTRATHDAKVLTGVLRLTLYGDLIKEDHEFHDTLNQRLETEELWETVGEEPVLDQFDVTYLNEMSGTYLDRVNILETVPFVKSHVFGTVTPFDFARDVGNFTNTVNNSKWSYLAYALNAGTPTAYYLDEKYAYELQKSSRNLNLSSDELFWDTRIPNPKETSRICNPNVKLSWTSGGPARVLYAGVTSSFGLTSGSARAVDQGLNDWYMTYPYESRYSDVSTTFLNELVSDTWSVGQSTSGNTTQGSISLKYATDMQLEVGTVTSASLYSDIFVSIFQSGMSLTEFAKVFYGIGNGVSSIANQFVSPRSVSSAGASVWGADIRGWRYGMMNAFPQKSSVVFRRDRFGQFRDMLEQRSDGKFYDQNTGAKESPVQVKFYDTKGRITDPAKTLSNNLSNEATSSLPYTDGAARSRSEYDLSNLNITTIAIST